MQTLISNDVYFDTAAPYLAEQKMPVFGFGISLGFYGPDKQTFFSPMGNWIAYQSNVGMKYLVDQGHAEDRRALRPEPGQRQRRARHRQRRPDRRWPAHLRELRRG